MYINLINHTFHLVDNISFSLLSIVFPSVKKATEKCSKHGEICCRRDFYKNHF